VKDPEEDVTHQQDGRDEDDDDDLPRVISTVVCNGLLEAFQHFVL
jgi:hypothetical protein